MKSKFVNTSPFFQKANFKSLRNFQLLARKQQTPNSLPPNAKSSTQPSRPDVVY
jgi:hypothetical protein